MKDIFSLLGIKQLNTTVYHPQCNGLTERFNQALKKAGSHIWATVGQISYRNTPHDAHDETGEKPSFLLFGMDCQQLLNLFELAFVLFHAVVFGHFVCTQQHTALPKIAL